MPTHLSLIVTALMLSLSIAFSQTAGATIQTDANERPPTAEQLRAALSAGKAQAAKAAMALAKQYVAQQSWSAVGEMLSEAIQLQPDNIGYLQAGTQFALDQKNYTAARVLLLRTIRIAEAADDEVRLLQLRDNLAVVDLAEGQLDRAEQTLQQNLDTRYRLLEKSDPQIATNLYRLASVKMRQGEMDVAEQQLLDALHTLKEQDREHGTLIAQILHNLGELYRTRQQLEQAAMVLREALRYWQAAPQQEQTGILLTLKSLREINQTLQQQTVKSEHHQAI